jgi:Mrp family chromosome partitioning ATPase
MSRNFAVLGKIAPEKIAPEKAVPRKIAPEQPLPAPGQYTPSTEYGELIQRLFHSPTAVAVMGVDPAERVSEICIRIAAELAASSRRVLVVSVEKILGMNPISVPDVAGFTPEAPNVWTWQSPVGPKLEIFRSRTPAEANWLEALRRSFDFILLDCSSVRLEAGAARVAVVADATVLVVQESQTEKQQVRSVQHTLQFSGARVAGSILVRQR